MSSLIARAALAIRQGEIILVPTDTNYALAANPWSEAACKDLYAMKRRDQTKPLTLFVANPHDALQYVDAVRTNLVMMRSLIDKYWPGPLNIIAPKSNAAPMNAAFDDHSISLVCNKNTLLRELINSVGFPLGLTSANISGQGQTGLINYKKAMDVFGDAVALIVPHDGTSLATSISSTIVRISDKEVEVLRQGDLVVVI